MNMTHISSPLVVPYMYHLYNRGLANRGLAQPHTQLVSDALNDQVLHTGMLLTMLVVQIHVKVA